jgi:hypothetical protein
VRRALAALAVLALAACDEPSPLVIDDPAEYLAELRAAECEYLVACHVFADAAQCTRRIDHPGLYYQTWRRPPGEPAWLEYVAAGTMSFDPAQAGACIEAIRRGACAPDERFGACWKVFRGIAAAGTVTTSEGVCASNHWSTRDCDQACCSGTCGPATGTPVGTPTTIDGIGDYCGATADGVATCKSHLACRDSACVALAEGDACFGTIECPAGQVCDGACRPRDEIGARCTRGPEGDSCDHVAAACADDGRCQRLGLEGEACSPSAPCRAYLHCDPAAGRCIAVYAEGEACGATSAPCDAGLECVSQGGNTPRCVATGIVEPVCP